MIALEITVKVHFESVARLCWLLMYCILTLEIVEKSVDRPGQTVWQSQQPRRYVTTNMPHLTKRLVKGYLISLSIIS